MGSHSNYIRIDMGERDAKKHSRLNALLVKRFNSRVYLLWDIDIDDALFDNEGFATVSASLDMSVDELSTYLLSLDDVRSIVDVH